MKKREIASISDESDRSVFIVAAAILEEELKIAILDEIEGNAISKKTKEQIFDQNGPLSGFYSKILISYAFGIITKEMYADLNSIRRLRNASAHSYDVVDFLDAEIKSTLFELGCCKKASELWKSSGLKRYDIAKDSEKKPNEYELRADGYIKYNKAIFCLGIKMLQLDIKLNAMKRSGKFTESELQAIMDQADKRMVGKSQTDFDEQDK